MRLRADVEPGVRCRDVEGDAVVTATPLLRDSVK